jgi:ankyrin repeat protein
MPSTETDLFAAIKAGDLERVKTLVSTDPRLVDTRSATGESAILTAVYNGRKEIANLLVARGATLTMFEACAAGEIDRVERLIAGGVPVNAHSDDGWTPLHLAAFFGHAKVTELLLAHAADVAARSRNANGNTPLHAALAANQKMAAGLLIGHGADVNSADAAGWRPLHLAAANNNLDVLRTLLAQGAVVDVVNADGVTPLGLAHQRDHHEAAALLQRQGATT